jgi:glycosyltransferase involved in cell wall biosynthesis
MQLVEAAKLLKKQSSDVQILLVGEGMEKPKLIDAARSEGLDNITFVESVPKSQINDFLNASDVCTAVLKRCDTFKTVYPNKVFDYMAAAKPIIIGIDGVARKLIEEAGAGVYVESENPKAFVEAINTMKNNPQIRESYGSSGLKYVQENFSRQKLANDYINLLEELLS